MLPGINRLLEHEGAEYLIECEDLGEGSAAFEIRIILKGKGSLLWQKQVSYRDLLGQGLDAAEVARLLREQMERTVETASAAVVKGKLAAL